MHAMQRRRFMGLLDRTPPYVLSGGERAARVAMLEEMKVDRAHDLTHVARTAEQTTSDAGAADALTGLRHLYHCGWLVSSRCDRCLSSFTPSLTLCLFW